MIDPRFATTGGPFGVPNYGGGPPQFPPPSRRHHRHRKLGGKHRIESPLSRDESIHKVGHTFHNNGVIGSGVPYGGGFQHQQPYGAGGANFGYAQQQQYNPHGGVTQASTTTHRRQHHRHNRHHGDVAGGQVVPEPLIGTSRPLDASGIHASRSRSPILDGIVGGGVDTRRRRHHHHHHSHHAGGHSSGYSVGSHSHGHHHQQHHHGGYGQISDDLIFIERGGSQGRQRPPHGYEYKGKIEIQGMNKEYRSRSRSRGELVAPPLVQPPFIPHPVGPPVIRPTYNPCPPGWQQMVLNVGGPGAPGGPCGGGGVMYTGQLVGGQTTLSTGFGHPGGVGGGGLVGVASSGLANLAANLPLPAHGQLVADYIVESATGIGSSGRSSVLIGGGGGGGGGHIITDRIGDSTFDDRFNEVEEVITSRPAIIEVWQKRTRERAKSSSSSSSSASSRRSGRGDHTTVIHGGHTFDFERFRADILTAIERIVRGRDVGPINPFRLHWTGHDGATQTEILGNEINLRPYQREIGMQSETSTTTTTTTNVINTGVGGGEVKVIVQPIQPVFYMPRPGGQTQIGPEYVHPVGPTTGPPNVVYVPRNVYVPVIKPVFVPRERVIVRPQIIHVARPVLVDRPVPVTQRPIIIDRERPVPVPVRGATGGGGGSKVIREEYVYRDNLPVAYGGRCGNYAGGINYGYMPTQVDHQYAVGSSPEAIFQTQSAPPTVIDMVLPNQQYQQSQSASHLAAEHMRRSGSTLNLNQAGGGLGAFGGNLVRTASGTAVNVGQRNQQVIAQTLEQSAQAAGVPAYCPTQIEVLDTSVNPFWQKTDQTTLMRRYGRPAYEIVDRSSQVEQQVLQEHGGGVYRSDSAGSFISGGVGGGGINRNGSFSSIPLGHIRSLNPEGIPHQGPAPIPIRTHY